MSRNAPSPQCLPHDEISRGCDGTVYEAFCRIAKANAGITLGSGKEAMVAHRVARRVRRLGLSSTKEYLRYLESDRSGKELVKFLDVISTNVTSFFREIDHFAWLETHIRRLVANRQCRIRIWSTASATGEEPYSIGMVALGVLGLHAADLKILATDISSAALATAAAGRYTEDRLCAVPKRLRNRYFVLDEEVDGGADVYRVRSCLRELITFTRLNLARPPFPMRGPMDVVFCRNVMIYFDRPAKQALLTEIARLLAPGGLLMVGHSECFTGMDLPLLPVGPSVYQKPDTAQGRRCASKIVGTS